MELGCLWIWITFGMSHLVFFSSGSIVIQYTQTKRPQVTDVNDIKSVGVFQEVNFLRRSSRKVK